MNRREFYERWKPCSTEDCGGGGKTAAARRYERRAMFNDLDSVIKDEGLIKSEEVIKLLSDKEIEVMEKFNILRKTIEDLEKKVETFRDVFRSPKLYTADEACDVALKAILVGSVVAEYPNLIRKAFGVKEGER
jgi:hypothetical protein